ncbi:MAG TPA: alpha/beta fold hydrolase [Anaerolineae bacterium]|nr:alpha/beta fold hydrolase [Anaerolineae bacterium]
MATYVLVHGAWHGGWMWGAVGQELRAAGHKVFAPTLTGSGERVHLASPAIGLDTHILDVLNVFHYENLSDVNLVGWSYGGMVTTGVAEQVPEKIHQLIYLDAFVPETGQSLADVIGPEITAMAGQLAATYGDGWRVPFYPPGVDRTTDFMLKAAQQPVTLDNPQAAQLARTYVHFAAKPPDDPYRGVFERIAARAHEEGWNCREMATAHEGIFTAPPDGAALLLELARAPGA